MAWMPQSTSGHQLNASPGQQHESGCRYPGVRVWVAPELGLRAGGTISIEITQPLMGDQEPDDGGLSVYAHAGDGLWTPMKHRSPLPQSSL